MKNKLKIIEFLGLPGSGKSYLAKDISRDRKCALIDGYNKLELYLFSILFVIIKPVLSMKILFLLCRENKHNKKLLYYKFLSLVRAMTLQMKGVLRKNSVIDEGFCQFAITLFDRRINESDLVLFDKLIQKRTKIFIIECDESLRLRRLEKRGKIPRARFGKEYAKFIQPIWIYNFEVIKNFYQNNFDTDILKN